MSEGEEAEGYGYASFDNEENDYVGLGEGHDD